MVLPVHFLPFLFLHLITVSRLAVLHKSSFGLALLPILFIVLPVFLPQPHTHSVVLWKNVYTWVSKKLLSNFRLLSLKISKSKTKIMRMKQTGRGSLEEVHPFTYLLGAWGTRMSGMDADVMERNNKLKVLFWFCSWGCLTPVWKLYYTLKAVCAKDYKWRLQTNFHSS